MGVTLDQILTLTGRLDDERGFDAPRERFRRFLLDHVTDPQIARALIEQCQHVPGEQHHRALHDLVVLLGRFLGFKTVFGRHGQWQSHAHLRAVVEVKADPAAGAELEGLLQSIALAAPSGPRPAGLCVITPLYMNRHKVEEALAAAKPPVPVNVVALRAVLSLVDFVSAGRMTHEEVVRLVESNISLDFIVALLEKPAEVPAAQAGQASPVPARPNPGEPAFWMATVASDHDTRPEEFLELVVARRLVFGIADSGNPAQAVLSGDSICFHITAKGVVGHARIASPGESGAGLRDAQRFRQLVRLENLELYLDAPVAVDVETQLRLRTAPAPAGRRVSTLVEISSESFETMTAQRRKPIDKRGLSVVRLLG